MTQQNKDLGVEPDFGPRRVSEVDKIVQETKQKIADGSAQAVGVSPSNSGRGHDPLPMTDGTGESEGFIPTQLDGAVLEEESELIANSGMSGVTSDELSLDEEVVPVGSEATKAEASVKNTVH